MRLTAELIGASNSYLNPLKERELDLRGRRIPTIENIGVASDHDAFDMTDNELTHLTNFPLITRLKTLLLARNRISTIQPTISKSIPNLTTLVLADNDLQELSDLEPLGGFQRLTHLVLQNNSVCKKDNYRAWTIWNCPSVRFLDFVKVKDAEREAAVGLFGTADAPSDLAKSTKGSKPRAAGVSTDSGPRKTEKNARTKLTPTEKKRVEQLIKNAKSLQEIARIEKDLQEGRIPGGILDEDNMS